MEALSRYLGRGLSPIPLGRGSSLISCGPKPIRSLGGPLRVLLHVVRLRRQIVRLHVTDLPSLPPNHKSGSNGDKK